MHFSQFSINILADFSVIDIEWAFSQILLFTLSKYFLDIILYIKLLLD